MCSNEFTFFCFLTQMNPYVNANGIRMACLCPSFADSDIIENTNKDQLQGQGFSEAVMSKVDNMS